MWKVNGPRLDPRCLPCFLVVTLTMSSILIGVVKSSPEIKLVSVEPKEFAPDTQIEDQELYLLTNVTRLEMHCKAHFPVQWDFAGDTVCFFF